jgi:hypothetical protein
LGRFRDSDLLRHIFERVVWAAEPHHELSMAS